MAHHQKENVPVASTGGSPSDLDHGSDSPLSPVNGTLPCWYRGVILTGNSPAPARDPLKRTASNQSVSSLDRLPRQKRKIVSSPSSPGIKIDTIWDPTALNHGDDNVMLGVPCVVPDYVWARVSSESAEPE